MAANWPVNDQAAYLLFGRFYTNLCKRKIAGSPALREAALWLKQLPNERAQQLLASRTALDFSNEPMSTEHICADTAATDSQMPRKGSEVGALSHPYFWGAFSYWGT